MAKRLVVVNQLRPRINSQGVTDLETLAGRVAKNPTYNEEEIYSVPGRRLFPRRCTSEARREASLSSVRKGRFLSEEIEFPR